MTTYLDYTKIYLTNIKQIWFLGLQLGGAMPCSSGVDTSRYFEGAKTRMLAGWHKLDIFFNQMVNKLWSYGQIVGIKCLS